MRHAKPEMTQQFARDATQEKRQRRKNKFSGEREYIF